ncbi:hypothetical protein FNF31_03196 [Cafeteria roenbergensis]|uniref:MTHFR SAM-binding regulatory domain-containing protein n=3 Tax=Cafeteria roenbergensis TaxID=33653 RepID=A0A5A8DZR4_CAFRO|nr:hypothetical protein FNF31_03196 [Cafeteria roenbergensis]KAA0170679.1 hypothetical protein FNF28_01224 [Cafeteria roenbergensis]
MAGAPRKVSDMMADAIAAKTPFYSFEFFPPKTDVGRENLFLRIDRMSILEPIFVDVTWTTAGDGKDSRDGTFSVCEYAKQYAGLTPMLHLTLTGLTRADLLRQLQRARDAGIRNILALRGDPPKGATEWRPCENGLSRAEELVRLIREEHGDWFCVAAAAFPEGYKEPSVPRGGDRPRAGDDGDAAAAAAGSADGAEGAEGAGGAVDAAARDVADRDAAVAAAAAKVAAGAEVLLTQCVYDVEAYSGFVAACRAAGVPESVPIVPGVLPVHGYEAFRRMTAYTGVNVPAELQDALDAAAVSGDDEAVRREGTARVSALCRALLEAGAPGLHFYTLNLEMATRAILKDVGLCRGAEARRLPWRPLGDGPGALTQVRPIFWANRHRSYVERTRNWDEQPTGRWGDGQSPAFGALSESHFGGPGAAQGTSEERRAIWGEAEALDGEGPVLEVFARYLEGQVPRLPWCDQALLPETAPIRERLVRLNRSGFCTINSQPRVNGARSDDPHVGWGGAGGRVYQKAYVECFCSPARLAALMEAAPAHPSITFTAVDASGNLYTNCKRRGVQAVTWGVFPGKEVLQPTVVDEAAFLAWKDEAFQLWASVWADAYPEDSPAAEVLHGIATSWYLVHVVDHDFVAGDVFRPFEAATAALRIASD